MKKEIEKLLEERKRIQSKRLDRYYERQHWYHRLVNHVCLDCRKSAKLRPERENKKCPHCGSRNFHLIGIFTRVPRKRASNSKWKKFIKTHYLDRRTIDNI